MTEAGAYRETPSLPLDEDPERLRAEFNDAIWKLARAAETLCERRRHSTAKTKATVWRSREPSPRSPTRIQGRVALQHHPGVTPRSPLYPRSCLLRPATAVLSTFQVRNEGDLDYYLAGFYVNSLGGVTAIPTNVITSGCVRTLPAGSEGALSFKFWIDTWDEISNEPSSTGVENFLLLAIPKDETRSPPALCALVQPTLVAAQQTRDIEIATGQENGLSKLINGIVDASSRGISVAAAGDDKSEITARLFILDVKP